MVRKIQNSDTIKEVREVARLSISEGFPDTIGDVIIPVVDVNPKQARIVNIIKTASSTSTGGTTIYSTPSDQDFYLTGIDFCTACDAASDNVSAHVTCTLNGVSGAQIIGHHKLTLTADTKKTSIEFVTPIKVDRGSNISMDGSFTVGAMRKFASIRGYLVQP